MSPARILYCHCRYAQVVPTEVKTEVLRQLCASGQPFEAVPDLCEMSARQDPSLKAFAEGAPVKIAACFPRAVKWIFHTAGADLPLATTEVLNMRAQSANDICAALTRAEVQPNLPAGRASAADAPAAPAPPATS